MRSWEYVTTNSRSLHARTRAVVYYRRRPPAQPVGGAEGANLVDLQGRGVLIAGARRVGAVVAHRLAREGASLALTYRSSQGAMERLRDELALPPGRVLLVQGDLSREDDVARVVQTARAGLGDLFAVVNLASDYERTPLDTLDGAAWDRSMATAKASYLLATHAARAMQANAGPVRGHLVLFGDWAAGPTPYRHYLPYLTAKAAVQFMARAFAAELAPSGILCNAVAPGPTIRPPGIPPAAWQRDVLDHTPLGRESSADDIAEVIVTLLRSESITGEVIRVDAGRHVAGPGWPS